MFVSTPPSWGECGRGFVGVTHTGDLWCGGDCGGDCVVPQPMSWKSLVALLTAGGAVVGYYEYERRARQTQGGMMRPLQGGALRLHAAVAVVPLTATHCHSLPLTATHCHSLPLTAAHCTSRRCLLVAVCSGGLCADSGQGAARRAVVPGGH